MKRTLVAIIIAAIMWFVLFSPWTTICLNFWISMSVAAVILIGLSLLTNKNIKHQLNFNVKAIIIGIVSAIVLWIVFYIGDFISAQLFDFAKSQVANIYNLRTGENSVFVACLLFFLIAPAEELFWRGCIQHKLSEKYGEWTGYFIAASIYGLVHIWSFNFMLITAALVCGGFWGLLYKYNKNIVTLIVSHACWNTTIFVLLPIIQ
ncbi:hypothetical protein EZS27_001807 [termite gut metagenome]|uniref:CAAX prenyl protease 2/Lysostaphin resistance protein A-like domain-containing protein n=1 Tax=termite gut metagenome TaxID=433724 RepID=A0A5J4SX91_9ZZZZ